MFEQKIKLSELIKNEWKTSILRGNFAQTGKKLVFLFLLVYNQARSQTFEKGGANFQEFMNSIYPEGYIVT